MNDFQERLMVIEFLQRTKVIYEKKLTHCLKIPVYKYFSDIYAECFDDKIKTDVKAVVVFQEKLKELKDYEPTQINAEAVKILSHASNCSVYITKLIEAVLTTNNRCQLLAVKCEDHFYKKQIPNSLLFFKTLLSQVSDLMYRDPFLFCKDKANSKVLKCINETLDLIQTCIENTISVLGFDEEHLDKYIDFAKNANSKVEELVKLKEKEKQELREIMASNSDANDLEEEFNENYSSGSESPDEEINMGDDNDVKSELSFDFNDPKMETIDEEDEKNKKDDLEDEKDEGKGDGIDNLDNLQGDNTNMKDFIPDQLALITYTDNDKKEEEQKSKKGKGKKSKKIINLNDT